VIADALQTVGVTKTMASAGYEVLVCLIQPLILSRRTIMNSLKATFSDLMHDESGQDLIEYALVAAIIALGATAAMGTLATTISTAFGTVGTKLTSAI
jgi:pilus assembly protein Flp/PilA